METTLFWITVILMAVLIAINLVLPLSIFVRGRRMATMDRRDAVKLLYGLHYERREFLIYRKRLDDLR